MTEFTNQVAINELESREAELSDLETHLPSNFGTAATEKDSMIRRRSKVIEDFKTIETRETDRLHKIIDDLESKLSEKPDTIGMLNYTTNIEKVVLGSRADDNIIEELKGTIDDLKDRNTEDLYELYDIYEKELRGLKADRTSIKSDRDIMFQNYRNTVAKLQGDIKGLEKERDEWRQSSLDAQHVIKREARHLIITDTERETDHAAIRTLNQHIIGLEAELSARKHDSEVLMKVVDVANRWSDERIASRPAMNQIAYLVKDYHDASEGPPETPIDDLYKVTVTYAFLEMP